ncbi:MAG: beta galactosidase jelly roll domain-containing protein [Clostridia bacterium]|nr:beta galactosidase jelly roll domain-containing protein [Clostridia bacterium]
MFNNKFDIESFNSPDVSYSPVYVWVWNDICTREIIDVQLAEMQNLGIRAFYILPEPKNFRPDSMPTNLTPDYLTSEYFELCVYAVEKGKLLGMNCWIYDEGGWPSGSACGKVLKDHPEYARQTLEFYERSFSAGEVYKKATPDVLATFLNDNELIEDGYIFSDDTVVTEYVAEKAICGNADYPDLLNKDATEYFIKITHEKYASAMKEVLGETVTAVFTDEPKAPSVPFNKELAEKYEATYGESILPYLPLIAENIPTTAENVHVLHRWYNLCSRMFCDNFLTPCRKWANERGIAFTGHMDMDHNPLGCVWGGNNFNLMRALRCFDIPGVDVIWRQLYPENKTKIKNDMNAYNGFFPRYASSAAAQNGTKLAMSEIFGVAGPGLTYDIMRYTVGYQAVRGINVFNPFNFPLGRKGALLAQELPVFTENQVYCRYLGQFNRYTERLSYISSLGERICETGLYYPVSDFQGGLKAEVTAQKFDTLGRTLENMMVDFDIVDDDVLQVSEITEDGSMNIGRAKYKHIIIPEGAFIPDATQKALNSFIECGGRVSYELTTLNPVIRVEGEGLRAMHRKAENAEIFCLFRETGDNGDYQIHFPSSKGYLLDLENGKLHHLQTENGILNLSLQIGETAVILLTDEILSAENKKDFKKKFDIKNEFLFRKELELNYNENGFCNIKHSDKAVPISLGDWSCLIGSAYSGSGVYETTFTLPAEKVGKEGEINLGDVHFAASVYLNDQFLGTSLMPPYRLKIPADVLDKENKLKIIVTNTSANLYVHTDYFDKWKTEELSPYFEVESDYAKDFVSGGLYGPVTLFTE